MGIFSNRKTRKSSPSPRSRDSQRTPNGSSTPGMRSRRSQGGLPLTTKDRFEGGTNFLLGGQYYSQKHRRVAHNRRRRRLGRRTRHRVGVLIGSAAVILVLLRFVPWLLDYNVNRKVDKHWSILRDTNLRWPHHERSSVAKLQIQLEAMDAEGASRERLKLLERLVPEFVSRNNKVVASKPEHTMAKGPAESPKVVKVAPKDTAAGDRKREGRHEIRPPPAKKTTKKRLETPDAAKRQESNTEERRSGKSDDRKQKAAKPKKERVEEEATEGNDESPVARPLRTLSNMDQIVNQTSCPADLSGSEMNITLVTQSSVDRLWLLQETCKRWHDPIVVVVPLTNEQTKEEATIKVLESLTEGCPKLTVVKHTLESSEPQDYPVNLLRNLGLDAVRTSHILISDIDFLPSEDLDSTIRDVLQLKKTLRASSLEIPSDLRDAMVVPAFERILKNPCTTAEECKDHLMNNSSFVPHSFDDLTACVLQKDCIVFQSKVNWEGHFTTDSEAWLAKKWFQGPAVKVDNVSLRDVQRLDCFDSLRYEPYVVIRWCPSANMKHPIEAVAPYYDERFHGYGKNKISYIQHLRISGYQFSVLPRGFLVHNPHMESQAKEVWSKDGSVLHHDMDSLYPRYLRELVDLYRPEKGQIVEMCSKP